MPSNRRDAFFLAVLCVSMPVRLAVSAQLPGTLNFQNVTATRVIETLGELVNNEKEVEFGDFDEDDDLDVVIANAYSDFGVRKNKLYRNDGGTFVEITNAGAIPGFAVDKVSRNAFFRDFNGDGHLDLYIVNDGNSNADQLFLAIWPGGALDHFEEVFNFVSNGSTNTGSSCGGWSADFDQDGDFDLFAANYANSAQDRLLLNLGTGSFIDVTATNVPAAIDYSIDACGADMNGDGNLDLLVSGHGLDQNVIYYNNNLGLGSGPGDFSYPGSTQLLGNPAQDENAMEAGDFDGDGDQDVYWSDGSGSTTDIVLRNNGNDASNKATFTTLAGLPASVSTVISRKATVADLNDDGRVDILVMKEATANGRPTILRNVTVNGSIQFVDWTPAPAFPAGNAHKGWHGAVFDSNGDGDPDIFLGGWSHDHLFESVPEVEVNEQDLGGALPPLFNLAPVAVVGAAAASEPDVYTASDLVAGGFISVVLNGPDDYLLEVLDSGGSVVASSNRGGLGVEEALQVAVGGPGSIRVTVLDCASPSWDLDGNCAVGVTDMLALLAAWGPNPGHPADFDGDGAVGVVDFLALLSNWGPVANQYILEALARS